MSLTKQKYHGKVTVSLGVNDQVNWEEDAGAGAVAQFAPIAPGSYYPKVLADDIATQMTFTSGAITYTANFDDTTGQVTFSASTGGFFFEIDTTEPSKLLTGGDVALGLKGVNHFGFVVAVDPLLKSATQTSNTSPAFVWYPDQPKATDDQGNAHSAGVQAVSMGGNVVSYDFSGTSAYLKTRSLSYERLSDSSRTQFDSFWDYAKGGDPFRFFDDTTSASYEERVLTGEILTDASFARTDAGLARWSLAFKMRLKKP